ncbi:U3 small nucleolar RNA-associated protein MPP10 [Smittium mucronatum]|uniref:U3 small nucleolar ribonucleoprotein protein MPP10 n=1 Tax=Smittium mucronatum TaxID=133383 RepID=A0A1R0GXM2_9FUNG|nr:U3 small nucleolar RNA-associated protein MPP10 [Smittium mucronatum]
MDKFILDFPDKPENYFAPNQETKKKCFKVSKSAFDLGNRDVCYGTLNKLLGEKDGFTDPLQIWEMIQTRNNAVFSHSKRILDDIPPSYNSFSQDDSSQFSESESEYTSESEDQSIDGLDKLPPSNNDIGLDSDAESEEVQETQSMKSDSENSENNDFSDQDFSNDDEIEAEEEDIGTNSDTDVQMDEDLDDMDDFEEHGEFDKKKKSESKKSIVDDDFFSLDQMHKFVENDEKTEMRDRQILSGHGDPFEGDEKQLGSDESSSEDEDVNYFEDIDDLDDDEDGEADVSSLMYNDFFMPVTTSKRSIAKESRESHAKRVKFDPKSIKNNKKSNIPEETIDYEVKSDDDHVDDVSEDGFLSPGVEDEDEDESSEKSANKSNFEIYQDKLKSQISKLEKDAVEKKDWVMSGEVTSRLRPIDSLLGEHLDYDYVQKPVPIITQKVTESLEELIKRRILASEYNDVERKKPVIEEDYFKSSRVELDENAPQKSLAEVYEQEYLAQREENGSGPHLTKDKSVYTDTELALHREINGLMKDLNYKLDSLTNFYYTPKVSTSNAEIKADVPAIQMEEALPIQVSSVSQLAPEEVYTNISGKRGKSKKDKSLVDSQTGDVENDAGYKGDDIISIGLGTGDIKGASEATDADRRRWRANKKKAFKKNNVQKVKKPE